MISSNTSLYGLIGNSVTHSYSPLILNYLFNYYSIDGIYLSFNVEKSQVADAIYGLKAIGVRGINITSPYKERVLEYVDDVCDDAADIGNINTIKNTRGKLIGYNTDYYGVIKTFEYKNVNLKNKKVLLLGAGEVAKTICFALQYLGAKEIIILNRTVEKAKKIANMFNKRRILVKYEELNNNSVNKLLKDVEIVINATSVDILSSRTVQIDFEKSRKNIIFFDVLYNPETLLIKTAKASGFKTINGMTMLLFQALQSFQFWTYIDITKDINIILKEINNILHINTNKLI